MTATTKEQPKWREFLSYLFRKPLPTPFWRKRLDDMVEPAEPIEVGTADAGPFAEFSDAIMLLAGGAIFVSALSALVGAIFLSPGFFEVGVADPLGRWYAGICVATGNCNLGYLLAGTVVGVLVLTLAGMLVLVGWYRPFTGGRSVPLEIPDWGTEIVDALEVLDRRLVRFRADLVLNGLLPLSTEEQEQDEEDDAKLAAESLPAFPAWLAALMGVGAEAVFTTALFTTGRVLVAWAGAFTPLVAMCLGFAGPFAVMELLMQYDRWARLQVVAASRALPPVAYTPGLHPWPNPEEALVEMVKAQPTSLAPYTRPELSKDDQAAAGQMAVKLTGNKSMAQIRAGLALLVLENQRLTQEVNAHRAARGFEPLPTVEAK